MKRYLVFSNWMQHESSGGWYDFKGDCETVDEYMDMVELLSLKDACIHVIDTQTGFCVYEADEGKIRTGEFIL